jgi:hypothetical protein
MDDTETTQGVAAANDGAPSSVDAADDAVVDAAPALPERPVRPHVTPPDHVAVLDYVDALFDHLLAVGRH